VAQHEGVQSLPYQENGPRKMGGNQGKERGAHVFLRKMDPVNGSDPLCYSF